MQARGNLMWDSAMAENGVLKVGRLTDFQAHQIEHQLLRQVADTCNIIKCNPRELSREEIYEILCECL